MENFVKAVEEFMADYISLKKRVAELEHKLERIDRNSAIQEAIERKIKDINKETQPISPLYPFYPSYPGTPVNPNYPVWTITSTSNISGNNIKASYVKS